MSHHRKMNAIILLRAVTAVIVSPTISPLLVSNLHTVSLLKMHLKRKPSTTKKKKLHSYMYTYFFFFIHVCWGVNNRDAAEGTDASCHIHISKVNSA